MNSEPDLSVLMGQNSLNHVVLTKIAEQTYLIPSKCKFIKNDVAHMPEQLNDDLYDLIVMDPPWWNKYIRRCKHANETAGYKMLDKHDILRMPVENLIKPNSLVAIWCTNAPSHIEFISKDLFSKWNLKLVSIWYWVKVK